MIKHKSFDSFKLFFVFSCLFSLPYAESAEAAERRQARVVGSSTVYPFVTIVAEEFGKTTDFPVPVVESTGTGGGFALFCAGVGAEHPDIADASRPIKDSEKQACAANGVTDVVELKIGYDGLVAANNVEAAPFALTTAQLRSAVAKYVVKNGAVVENPYRSWNEIDASLPATKIAVYGPPSTSGTRDSLLELVVKKGCTDDPAVQAAYPDEKQRDSACGMMREDGGFIDASENDNLIIQKLRTNKDALGIFGFSYLEQNESLVHGASIDGVAPDYEHIADGSYPLTRPLFLYVKKASLTGVAGVKEFLTELLSDNASGEDGYLTYKGLIPVSADERKADTQEISGQ
jgi:phosphate transport system substrate-binding protein